MPRILVIAHLNHDRIWQLDSALESGARISWTSREIKIGGGGFFTGSQLLNLGHKVMLVSSLGNDTLGRSARQMLSDKGFDMAHVFERDSETRITDILLEPSGERTILNPSSTATRVFALQNAVAVEAAYFNCQSPDDQIIAAMASIPFVVTQLPISDTAALRPADLVITSKSDFPALDNQAIWDKAIKLCGSRLKHLVVTNGTRCISIYDGKDLHMVTPVKRNSIKNTIGAGDNFAAGLTSSILGGLTIEDAVRNASEVTANWLESIGTPEDS